MLLLIENDTGAMKFFMSLQCHCFTKFDASYNYKIAVGSDLTS